jgi:RuvA, C-terminal domain
MEPTMRHLSRVFPWVLSLIFAAAVWRDHSRSQLPWLISLALAFACGWFQGRRRPWSRKASRVATTRKVGEWQPLPPGTRPTFRVVQAKLERPPEVLADVISALVNLDFPRAQAKVAAEKAISTLGAGAKLDFLIREALRSGRSESLAVVLR